MEYIGIFILIFIHAVFFFKAFVYDPQHKSEDEDDVFRHID